MRNYFIFNGVDSRDFGVYISGQGTFSAPQKAYQFYNIPGRNGALLGNEHRLENINVSYEAFIYTDFDNNLAAFRSFLLSINGYARLTDSYHPDEFRMAVYTGPFEPKVDKKNDCGSFTITFSCKPQRWLISGDTTYSWTAGGAQDLVGSEISLYVPKIDTSYMRWSYEDHTINFARVPAGNAYQYIVNIVRANSLDIKVNGTVVKTYTLPSVTKASANLISGVLTVNGKIGTAPKTGWESYSTHVFRVPTPSNWSKIKAACRFSSYVTTNPYPPTYQYTVFDTLAQMTASSLGYCCCIDSGYLYVKDVDYSSYSQFQTEKGGFTCDTELATPSYVSIDPFSLDFSGDFVTISSSLGNPSIFSVKQLASDSMSNPTAFPSQPIVRVYGNGSFTMDGITVTVTNATSYTDIDCEAMDCYEGSTNRNNDVSFSTYDFPKLQPGDNAVNIVSGITAVQITPRWWRL